MNKDKGKMQDDDVEMPDSQNRSDGSEQGSAEHENASSRQPKNLNKNHTIGTGRSLLPLIGPRKLSQALVSSDPQTGLNLIGDIPANTHKALARIADAFGQRSTDAFEGWLGSPAFCRFFSPMREKTKNLSSQQGPAYAAVRNAIAIGERNGTQRYSARDVDTEDFITIDWYALCLSRMTEYNMSNRDGIFFGKKISEGDAQVRLWQAILRATYNDAPSRRFQSINAQQKALKSSKNAGISSPASLVKGSGKHSRRAPSGSDTESDNGHDEGSGKPHPGVASDAESDNGHAEGSGKPSSGAASDAESDNGHAEGSGKPSSGAASDAESDNGHAEGSGGADNDKLDDWDKLVRTGNKQNPFDLTTRYGKYLTITKALGGYKDPVAIQTLYVKQQPAGGPDIDMDMESRQWYEELEAKSKGAGFSYRRATDAETISNDRIEKLLDNTAFQRLDYIKDCQSLGIIDPNHPQLDGMMRTMVLNSWQVTGIKALLDFRADEEIKGCVLADNTGLGKTMQCLGYWAMRQRNRKQELRCYAKWVQDSLDVSLDAGPPPPTPSPARPLLLVVPGEVIHQWGNDIQRIDSKWIQVLYYGNKKQSISTAGTKVDGFLLQDSPYFNGAEKNARTVIITSPDTLRARHGPSALSAHRRDKLGFTHDEATAAFYNPDRNWERDLSGRFDTLIIDEAHCIKNPEAAISYTVKWLNADFTILATATVLPNSIADWSGFANIIQGHTDLWTDANLRGWGVREDVNPFELPDNHPAAVLRTTLRAVNTWITGPDAPHDNRGFYLQKAWRKCLVRRTYVSKDPAKHDKVIGESLPKLHSRRIVCRFTPEEQVKYNTLSATPLKKLAHFLPDGKVCWNRKYYRKLTLLSTALSYQWTSDYVTADSIMQWKRESNCLWSWLELIRDKQTDATGQCDFILPMKDDITKQLAIVFQGSPKLRQLMQIVASLVLVAQRKVGIWCSLPANQVLLHACFQALQLDAAIYTAELGSNERQALVERFTTEPHGCPIFVGSFSVGSVGLNLQAMCHHTIDFDSPMNAGQRIQATGRFWRLTQLFDVERFELSVEESFQSRIISNAMMKALGGVAAELSVQVNEHNIRDVDNNLTRAYSIGSWFRVGDELIEAPDPKVDHLPADQKLSAQDLLAAILDISRGKREESRLNHHWVQETVVDDIDS